MFLREGGDNEEPVFICSFDKWMRFCKKTGYRQLR
jgi:hypothetical protein